MLKSIFKITSLFLAVIILSAIASSAAFIITKNILNSSAPVQAQPILQTKTTDEYVVTAEQNPVPSKFDFYVVRLEGNSLNIYASSNGKEEFLYNADICKADLSVEDTRLLINGVTLSTSAKLTEFIENYTS